MRVIILAAGLGTRLRPLTLTTPKALLPINNIPLIEHTLAALPSAISEIVMVVHYLGDQIKNHLGSVWNGIPISYLSQKTLNGTGGAIKLAQEYITAPTLVLNGDDLYDQASLEALIEFPTALLISPTEKSLHFGVQLNNDRACIGLGPSDKPVNYRVCGAYTITPDYFSLPPITIDGSIHAEYGLPQTLTQNAAVHPIPTVLTRAWFPVGTPEEYESAQTVIHNIA